LDTYQPWYCVECQPCQETRAARELRNQSFMVFLPRLVVEHTKRGTVMVPLFPKYLFVSFDVVTPRWRSIHSTFGVRRLMSCNAETPLTVPENLMAMLIVNAGPDQVFDFRPAGPRFHVEQRLRVTSGPFENFEGLCTATGPRRVSLLLEFLGGQREVTVDADRVAVAAEAA
jgi:transcriptional antiterminator RfaH